MSRKTRRKSKQKADACTRALARIEQARKSGATELDLSRLGLTKLPETISHLTQLQQLHLNHNRLTELPEAIGRLTRLQILSVDRNRLTTWPKSIGRLTQLRELILFDNQLTKLPESIGRLTHLQALGLSFNQLTSLPKFNSKLTQLRKLYLSDNQLTTLTESVGQLKNLRSLALSCNHLIALPESLQNLRSLKELYLHGNDALGLSARILGPTQQNVINKNAKPAKPSKILEYYFSGRRGKEQLNEVDTVTRQKARKMGLLEKAVRVFCSYSHRDENMRNELETHLKLLQRQGLIQTWHDRKIEAGDEWKRKIDENLERADIILLLVSANFLASDYCYEIEMKRALERHDKNEARVIPVIVRDVNWHRAPFAKLQALPKDGKAVKRWSDRESAWSNVAEGIERVVEEIRKRSR